MTGHSDHKFSVTLKTADLAVVGCLRALAKWSQKTGNNQIPWGGTKDVDWKHNKNCVTFRFSSSEYRAYFVNELQRLLPRELWVEVGQRDDDPATRQR